MRKRSMTVLAVCGLCILCTALGVCAATAIDEIRAELRPDFTIVIDGETKTFHNAAGEEVYPLLYEGSTYLPVRAIGELMGKTVYWYEDEKKVELKDPDATVTDADVIVPSGQGGSAQQTPAGESAPAQQAPAGGGGSAPSTPEGASITAEQAKQIALQRAGLNEADVRFDRTELDREHGELRYEVEFRQGRTEYSAEISAVDGTIRSWEVEND